MASIPFVCRHPDVEEAHVGTQLAGQRDGRVGRRAAWPTTSMSGCASRIMLSPVRTISWSSATSTRIVIGPDPPWAARRADGPAPVAFGAGLEAAAQQGRPLGHADEPVARHGAPVAAAHRRRRRRAAPSRPHPVTADVDPRGVPGMAHRVGDRLLRDPVDRCSRRGTDVVEVTGPARRRPAAASPAPRASSSRSATPWLRRELGLLTVAQRANHQAHLGEGARRPPPR